MWIKISLIGNQGQLNQKTNATGRWYWGLVITLLSSLLMSLSHCCLFPWHVCSLSVLCFHVFLCFALMYFLSWKQIQKSHMKPNGCLNDLERDWSSGIRMAGVALGCSQGVSTVVLRKEPKDEANIQWFDLSASVFVCCPCTVAHSYWRKRQREGENTEEGNENLAKSWIGKNTVLLFESSNKTCGCSRFSKCVVSVI